MERAEFEWVNSLETGLQVLATRLQLARVVQGAVCGRSEGAIVGTLGKLELTVLGNVAAVIGYLRRGTLVAGNALALERRENRARRTAIHVGYQILVAFVVDLAVVVIRETSFLGTNGRIIGTHALHTATAARVEFLEGMKHISCIPPHQNLPTTYLEVGTLAEDHAVGSANVVILLLIRVWLDAHIVARAAIVLEGKEEEKCNVSYSRARTTLKYGNLHSRRPQDCHHRAAACASRTHCRSSCPADCRSTDGSDSRSRRARAADTHTVADNTDWVAEHHRNHSARVANDRGPRWPRWPAARCTASFSLVTSNLICKTSTARDSIHTLDLAGLDS